MRPKSCNHFHTYRRSISRNLLNSLTVLFFCVAAQAQVPDARDLLIRASSSIFVAKTVRLEGTHSRRLSASNQIGTNVAFKLAFVRGGRSREEWTSGSTINFLSVVDGSNLWQYRSLGNQYTKTPLSTWQYQNEILDTLDYGRNSVNIVSASVESEEAVQFAGRPVSCYVVRAAYRGAPSNRSSSSGKEVLRRVWIAKDTELVLRDYWEGALEGSFSGDLTSMYSFALIETDTPLPDDLFAFQPPPGSKVGPPVVLGGIIGNVPAAASAPRPPARDTPVLAAKVDPGYTPSALADGLQGCVLLNIQVSEEGRVEQVRVSHSLGMGLDEQAIAAVKQWQYKPSPTSRIRRIVEVPFRLDPPGPWILDGSVLSVNLRSDIRGPVEATKPKLHHFSPPDSSVCSAHGYVEVNFNIEADGAPSAIQITNAFDDVRDGVLRAVKSWQFEPATINGSNALGHARILLECRPPAVAGASPFPPEPPVSVGNPATAAPTLLFKIEPEYNEEARRARLQGDITLSLVVQPDGKPSDIHILRGLGSGLNEEAIAAVMQWRFRPGTRNGNPLRITAQISVSFRLE